jgi:hypothetical protein
MRFLSGEDSSSTCSSYHSGKWSRSVVVRQRRFLTCLRVATTSGHPGWSMKRKQFISVKYSKFAKTNKNASAKVCSRVLPVYDEATLMLDLL